MKILVTGATGYIGSHLCALLEVAGHEVSGLDREGRLHNPPPHYFIQDDARSWTNIHPYDVVVHLAGLISVEESTRDPLSYWDHNLNGTINILNQTKGAHFIFASTAGAYDPHSPYAYSKLACEDIIRQLATDYTIYRFFNVAGSNGTNHQLGKATHLIRVAAQSAINNQSLPVYGTDYDTQDGTCIRDYIHVLDLCERIVRDLDLPSNRVVNIGGGTGTSVLDVVTMINTLLEEPLELDIRPRRPGDPETLVATDLDFRPSRTLRDMCESTLLIEKKCNEDNHTNL